MFANTILARSYLVIAPTVTRSAGTTMSHSRFRIAAASSIRTPDGKKSLDVRQQRQVDVLKQRDKEVRTHEAAHLAAAGGYARGTASFSYTRGADGQLYASDGSVSIDTSPVAGDPRATLQKAETIERAALAPAEPSGQDHQVARQAATMASQARQELTQKMWQASKSTKNATKSDKSDTSRPADAEPAVSNAERTTTTSAKNKEAAAATLSCTPAPRLANRLRTAKLLAQMESQRQHWVA